MLQKKDIGFTVLKRFLGEYAPFADVVNRFLKHKDIKARPLSDDEKQKVRTHGLGILVFHEKEKHFKKYSPEKKKTDTTFIFKPKSRIYGFSNGFKRCTFMCIGQPNDEMVMTQLNHFSKKEIPSKVYYAWIDPSDITEEMLNTLLTRDFDGVIIYDKQVETKNIKRIDKVSMAKTKFFNKYAKVFNRVLWTGLGGATVTSFAGYIYTTYLSDSLYSLIINLLF